MKTVEEMMKELPTEYQKEVLDFIEFLLEKRIKKAGKRLRQDWAGALEFYKDKYTSLELQHKISELRIIKK